MCSQRTLQPHAAFVDESYIVPGFAPEAAAQAVFCLRCFPHSTLDDWLNLTQVSKQYRKQQCQDAFSNHLDQELALNAPRGALSMYTQHPEHHPPLKLDFTGNRNHNFYFHIPTFSPAPPKKAYIPIFLTMPGMLQMFVNKHM